MAKTRKRRSKKATVKLLIVGPDVEGASSAARGLMGMKKDFVMLRDPARVRTWLRSEENRRTFGGLIVAIGQDGEGLDLIRDLRDQETVNNRPRRPMIVWSNVHIPDADKVCTTSGADAILHRDRLPELPATLAGLKRRPRAA